MEPPSSRSEEVTALGTRRRQLLKAGVASAPVLMTLAGRPVLGSVQCTSCSAYSSLGGSLATRTFASCSGKTPSTWASTESWPDPYHATLKHGSKGYEATLYHCSTSGLGGYTFSGSTMYDVLCLTDDGSTRSLGRYVAAALLNAKAGLTPVLTETTVRRMWNDYTSYGRYEPTPGVRWGASQIVAYIKSTIG